MPCRKTKSQKKRIRGEKARIVRKALYKKQKGKCYYCEINMVMPTRRTSGIQEDNWATLDHVKMLGEGGSNKWSNIVVACYLCNQRRNTALQINQSTIEEK